MFNPIALKVNLLNFSETDGFVIFKIENLQLIFFRRTTEPHNTSVHEYSKVYPVEMSDLRV